MASEREPALAEAQQREREAHASGLSLTDRALGEDAWARSILDALPALVAYVRSDLTYALVSRGYEDWFGLSAENVVGKSLEQVLGAQVFSTLKPHVERALRGEKVAYDAHLPYKTGGARWVRASYLPDTADDGSVRGFVALVTDIGDQKLTEQRLAEEVRSKEQLAHLGMALVSELDIEAIFRRLTDEATQLCRAQFGAFFYNVIRGRS
jgi:PAS domain S-box-containing protein